MKKKAEAEKQLQSAITDMVLEEEDLIEKERAARHVEDLQVEAVNTKAND